MRLKILGCSGSRYPGEHSPAFLIDDRLLLDAGTVCGALHADAQAGIESVLITHPHLDHVCGLANLAENLAVSGAGKSITVYGSDEVIEILRENLFNGLIWPDFGVIPDSSFPVIHWVPLELCKSRIISGYRITPIPVSHSVPAVGYLIASECSRLIFTGDTGPTDLIWNYGQQLSLLIAEVSFPDSQEELAIHSGHLTPKLLERELHKLPEMPERIMVMHMKSMYRELIIAELARLDIPTVEVMQEGCVYDI